MLKVMLIVFLTQWYIGFAMGLFAWIRGDLSDAIESLRLRTGSQFVTNLTTAVVILAESAILLPSLLIVTIKECLRHEES